MKFFRTKNRKFMMYRYFDAKLDMQKNEARLLNEIIKNENLKGSYFFDSFTGEDLYKLITKGNSLEDLIILVHGKVRDRKDLYFKAKKLEKGYYVISIMSQLLYFDMFKKDMFTDNRSDEDKIHAYNCVLSDLINNICIGTEIKAIGLGIVERTDFKLFIDKYDSIINPISEKKDIPKAAVYTGMLTMIGTGALVGLKYLSKIKKHK